MSYKKIICIDFDGVIHSYSSGWQGVDVVADPPVDGAIEWLHQLVTDSRFEPVIYSSRSKEPEGVEAMKKWFEKQAPGITRSLQFPIKKPAAFMTIDDRAMCFTGVFPSLKDLNTFMAWNKIDSTDDARVHAKRLYGPRADVHINKVNGKSDVFVVAQYADDLKDHGLWGDGANWQAAFDDVAARVRGEKR
jgi:hypothetical protein